MCFLSFDRPTAFREGTIWNKQSNVKCSPADLQGSYQVFRHVWNSFYSFLELNVVRPMDKRNPGKVLRLLKGLYGLR